MTSPVTAYTTRELSNDTLPDFEQLLETRPAPGAFNCWCMYNHRPGPLPESRQLESKVKQNARNRKEKRALVANGRSHGILVYADGAPIGWCQFGYYDELPRLDNYGRYRKFARGQDVTPLWRITCFIVDKKHRKRGVARLALRAALEAIRSKGGGIVEAYPILRPGGETEYRGSVSMFQKEGFEVVAPFGSNNAIMRKTV